MDANKREWDGIARLSSFSSIVGVFVGPEIQPRINTNKRE